MKSVQYKDTDTETKINKKLSIIDRPRVSCLSLCWVFQDFTTCPSAIF